VISSTSLSDASGPVVRDAAGRFLVASPTYGIARIDLSVPPDQIACVRDAADLSPIVHVVPGELMPLYGTNLGNYGTLPFSNGALPTSLSGLQIDFDGLPAPLLYVSQNQINLQAPYEIAGKPSVTMTLSEPSSPLIQTERTLNVGDQSPSLFSQPAPNLFCGHTWGYMGILAQPVVPTVLNPDGTVNSCDNPAPTGSTVAAFVEGLGIADPFVPTGHVTATSLPLTLATTPPGMITAQSLAGSISGVWQLQISGLNRNGGGCPSTPDFLQLTPSLGGAPTREPFLVWVGGQPAADTSPTQRRSTR
jgi:uncharacterized protein (TIGR03437 family)